MAPSKAQPPQAQAKTKTGSGHNAKKPTAQTSATSATSASGAARPVVLPAIPLPMMQRQSTRAPKVPTNYKKQVPAATSSSNGFPAASLDAALIDQSVSPDRPKITKDVKGQHLQSAKPSQNEVNGSNVEKPEHTTTQTNAIPATATATATTADVVATNGANASSGHARAPVNGTNGNDTQSQQTAAASQLSSAQSTVEVESNTTHPTSTSAAGGKPGAQDAQSHTSQPESIISPRRIDQSHVVNPQVYPHRYQQATDRRPDPSAFYPSAHMHRHHMSNGGGGIMFGGFPESHTPSPAPPPGAFMPPPPMPVNGENPNFARVNGHHHAPAPSNSNGFPAPAPAPINTQFRPDLAGGPASSVDTYGPPSAHVPQGPFDAFAPGANRYGPPTPHSFHGSHASGEPNGMESGPPMPFPPNGMHYPSHGHHEHPAGHQHPPHLQHHPHAPFPPFPPSQAFARRHQSVVESGELMESVSYFRNQFDNGELADCVLELVYSKGRHHPVKITGHKLILAQSPALKHYIMSARNANNSGSHTITIESDDAYLRSDAWWMAVQRLYLHPLLNIPPIIGNAANGMDFAGDKTDRFEFCLGYASAGHLLEIQDVLVRGLQIAANLLNWTTVEYALGFVFEGTSQRHTDYGVEQDGTSMSFMELEYGYGPETKILMDAIMTFLVDAFPPNFDLDSTVPDPAKYARIPAVPSVTTSTSPTNGLPPAIARGSNLRNSGKPRLGSIKFGDLPAAFPEDGPIPQRESAKCSPILSRILLNLPFDELRAVMTSESNAVSGWNTAQDRYHAVADVVAAREARRLRAVDAVRAGAIPNALEIQKRLSAHRRHAIVETWDVLNWQEEVIQPRGAEVPRLVRKWTPQFSAPPERELRRHVPTPAYDTSNSMV